PLSLSSDVASSATAFASNRFISSGRRVAIPTWSILRGGPGISAALSSGIAPVEIEPCLDARCEQQRAAGLATHAVFLPLQQLRDARDDLASSVTQQVDGVFDAACTPERARVHGDAKSLR